MERVSLGEMPDRDGDSAPWLEHPQHLTNRTNGRREKHHAEATDHSIEGVGWDGKIVGERHLKVGIVKSTTLPFSTSSFHHFRSRIYAQNLTLRSNQVGNAQCRFSRTRGYVEDKAAGGDLCIFNESLSDRRKHLPDNLSVLFPVGRRFAPLANDFLILLHRSYLIRSFHFYFSGRLQCTPDGLHFADHSSFPSRSPSAWAQIDSTILSKHAASNSSQKPDLRIAYRGGQAVHYRSAEGSKRKFPLIVEIPRYWRPK